MLVTGSKNLVGCRHATIVI